MPYAKRDGVRLHYLDNGAAADDSLTPLVMVPGGLSTAQDYMEQFSDALAPRRLITLDLRGRGRSDSPTTGYSPRDQVEDIAALLDALALPRYVLFAFSMNVPAALLASMDRLAEIAAVIVGDYPARFPSLTLEWVERVVLYMGRKIPAYVPQAMQSESVAHPIWGDLSQLTCPVLLMRGTGLGSLLTQEDADAYHAVLPDPYDAVFEGADHNLWRHDFDHFMTELTAFIAHFD